MIHLVAPSAYLEQSKIIESMYKLRYKIFFEKLKWQVNTHSGMEKDELDEKNTYYLVYVDANDKVRGCQRYIRMDNECMFDKNFKSFSNYITQYKNSSFWEASRLAVDYEYDEHYSKADAALVCKRIFAASVAFGTSQNAKGFLTLSYPSVVKLLQKHFYIDLVSKQLINNEEICVTLYPPKDKPLEQNPPLKSSSVVFNPTFLHQQ